ncbi:MAG: hypothetical protein Kow00124_00460 [Anaerolineae bacterium]
MLLPDTPSPLTAADRRRVLALYRTAQRHYLQLDWHSLEAWLTHPDLHCWAFREYGRLRSLLGAAVQRSAGSDDQHCAWVRLAVSSSAYAARADLPRLWDALRPDLAHECAREVALLELDIWVGDLAREMGFEHTNDVITLSRNGGDVPPPPGHDLVIRPAAAADLDAVARLDAAAFSPIWRYNRETLQAASLQAVTFTVLEGKEGLLGYQLSTEHEGVGHLARLAVLPEAQGRGYGALLVGSMIRCFRARGIHTLTVNTQADNIHSQRLYRRLGFRPTGHRVPVWTAMLE